MRWCCHYYKNAVIDSNFIALESLDMAVITVRNLPDATHRALRVRAAQHGRSTEAEIRAILEETVRPQGRVRIGSALAAFGKRFGGVEIEVTRDQSPPRAASFE
jgi:plasmid stability protein